MMPIGSENVSTNGTRYPVWLSTGQRGTDRAVSRSSSRLTVLPASNMRLKMTTANRKVARI